MKRICSFLLIVCLMFGISSLYISPTAQAFYYYGTTYKEGYLTYGIQKEIGKSIIVECNKDVSGDFIIPDTLGGYPVDSIASSAFSYCHKLTSVIIPDSVTDINDSFIYCTNLSSFTIPKGVTDFSATFSGCTQLTYINVDSRNTTYTSVDGVVFDKSKQTLICCPTGKSGCYTIPNGTKIINDWAFSDCMMLTSVIIPNSVTNIGYAAFNTCVGLTSLTIGKGVSYIGSSNFDEGLYLDTIYYCGSSSDKKNITILEHNRDLSNANWYYNACYGKTSHSYSNSCDTSCNICSATRSVVHTYTDACDSYCDICYFHRESPHIYSDVCDAACDDCGYIRSSVPHIYDNGCDISCNSCNYIRIPEPHKAKANIEIYTLSYSPYEFLLINGVYSSKNTVYNDWQTATLTVVEDGSITIEYCTSTEKNHDVLIIEHNKTTMVTQSGITSWETITVPVVAGDKIYITYSTDNSIFSGDNKVYFKISSLGYVLADDVTPTCEDAVLCGICGVTVKDALGHAYSSECDIKCNSCQKERTVSVQHVFDNACDTVCDRCEYTRSIKHEYQFIFDAVNHFNKCTICSDIADVKAHEFDNACDTTCSCGYIRTVPDHRYTLNGNHTCNICKYSKTPSKPTIERKTNNSVTLIKTAGFEYSKDGTTWQTDNVFTDLSADTTYTFYQRVKASTAASVSEISEGTVVTFKSAQTSVPSAPIVSSFTDTTVTLIPSASCEFSKDGSTWQTSNIFTELSAGTKYTFYKRYAETETHEYSNKSAGTSVTTDKSKQELVPETPVVQDFTSSRITLVPVDGCEYSKNGTTWQSSNVFTGLSCGTAYTFYQRYKETTTTYAGKSSGELVTKTDKGTQSKPSAPTLSSKTYNSVALTAKSGYEYSRDGINWQTDNVFNGLSPETNYIFYQRRAETSTHYASESSPSLTVKTNEQPEYTLYDYTIVFKDWDGTVLSSGVYKWGDKITMPANPARQSDYTYTYTFAGWDKAVINCAGNAIYTATYTPTYINYTVEFKNWNGEPISSNTYHYGDIVQEPNTPTKEKDEYYIYTFAGWNNEVVPCTGNAAYTACFYAEHYHTFDKHVVASKYLKSAASCSSAAVYYKSCECGANGTTTFTNGGKADHKYDSGEVTQAATCNAAGVKTYTCSVCKSTKTETVAKLTTHTYSNDCDTACNICGAIRSITHKYGNYIYNNDATATKDGTKTRTCSVCGKQETITAAGTKWTNPFKDVKASEYFYTPVLWAVANNVTSGTSATTFSPNDACTRGQIVTFLWRAAGSPAPKGNHNPFKDVKSNQYYYTAVLWAVENGITSGTSATTFSPNDACTRGQIVTFLYRSKN